MVEGDASSLFELAPYLKPYVIKTPTKEWKVYGQTHIIHHRLRVSIPLAEHIKAPYIILSITSEVGKGFIWFWSCLNDLESDDYWKRMTLSERLDAWQYVRGNLPNIYRWYYENLFSDHLNEGSTELIPILSDIVSTMPAMVPLNNRISSFDIAYRRITGHPFPSLREVKKVDGWPSIIEVIELENGESMIYRLMREEDAYRELVPSALAVDEFEIDALSKRLFTEEENIDEHSLNALLIADTDEHRIERHSLYDLESKTSAKVKGMISYTGRLHKREEICHPPSRDYIDSIFYPIKVGDLTLHGDLLVMRKRSPFVRSIDNFDEGVVLLGWRIDLLLPIWEYINGRSTCAVPVPESFDIINYFQIPFDSSFVERYIYDLLLYSKRGWDEKLYLRLLGILRSIPKPFLSKYRITEEKLTDISIVMLLHQPQEIIELSKLRDPQRTTLADEILAQIHVPSTQLFSPLYKDYVQVLDGTYNIITDVVVIWYIRGVHNVVFPLILHGSRSMSATVSLGPGTSPIDIWYIGDRWIAYQNGNHIPSVITVMRSPEKR